MLSAYVNYPNTHVTIHPNPTCSLIRMRQKEDQRRIRINTARISSELLRFESQEHCFGNPPETNDMWLEVDFGDSSFERAVVEHIIRLLARHYSPFRDVQPLTHDCG